MVTASPHQRYGRKYTQILIDSRPIFSALAGVYGLEQIPANMIERVEVIRGGGSALFGSSAIAGTINIITKEPIRNSGSFGHTILIWTDLERMITIRPSTSRGYLLTIRWSLYLWAKPLSFGLGFEWRRLFRASKAEKSDDWFQRLL